MLIRMSQKITRILCLSLQPVNQLRLKLVDQKYIGTRAETNSRQKTLKTSHWILLTCVLYICDLFCVLYIIILNHL